MINCKFFLAAELYHKGITPPFETGLPFFDLPNFHHSPSPSPNYAHQYIMVLKVVSSTLLATPPRELDTIKLKDTTLKIYTREIFVSFLAITVMKQTLIKLHMMASLRKLLKSNKH